MKHPTIQWAQNDNFIFIDILLEPSENVLFTIKNNCLTFKQDEYECELNCNPIESGRWVVNYKMRCLDREIDAEIYGNGEADIRIMNSKINNRYIQAMQNTNLVIDNCEFMYVTMYNHPLHLSGMKGTRLYGTEYYPFP